MASLPCDVSFGAGQVGSPHDTHPNAVLFSLYCALKSKTRVPFVARPADRGHITSASPQPAL
jgi:hypothetical protein